MSKIQEILQEHQTLTREQIIDLTDLPERAVLGYLGSLVKKGIVERLVNEKGEVVFSLAAAGIESASETKPEFDSPIEVLLPKPRHNPFADLIMDGSPKTIATLVAGMDENGSFHLVDPENGSVQVISEPEANQIQAKAAAISRCLAVHN